MTRTRYIKISINLERVLGLIAAASCLAERTVLMMVGQAVELKSL